MVQTRCSPADEEAANCEKSTTHVFDTAVTIEYLEKRLTASLNTSSKFGKNLKFVRLGVGQGFMSVVARIYPDWTPEDSRLPKSFIAKIPDLGSTKQVMSDKRMVDSMKGVDMNAEKLVNEMISFLNKAHNAEVQFYELAKNHKIGAKFPKMYYSEKFCDETKQGLLLMEDLGETAIVLPHYQAWTVEQVKQALGSIAAVHGFSMRHSECLNIGYISFAEMMKDPKKIQMFSKNIGFLANLDENKLKLLSEQLTRHINAIFDATFLTNLHKDYGLPAVLTHGDFWSPNILWSNENGKLQILAIIDWQIIHKGCAAEDIVRLISSAMTAADRRRYLDEILLHYYKELEQSYGEKLPFDYEQLKGSVVRIYPFAMAMILPIFGKHTQLEIEDKHPDLKDEFLSILKEKAIGIAEDILHYLKFNGCT